MKRSSFGLRASAPVATLAFMLTVVGALLACKASVGGEGKANVNCLGTSETIDCTVTHTDGDKAVNVCWDLKFECENGKSASSANNCQDVEAKGTAVKKIPVTSIEHFADCDKVKATEIVNMKLTAK